MRGTLNWSIVLTNIIPILTISKVSSYLPDFATLHFLNEGVVLENGETAFIELTCFFQDGKEKKYYLKNMDLAIINAIKKHKKIILCELDSYGNIFNEYWLRVIT